jgi:cysteine-rich repeat protein
VAYRFVPSQTGVVEASLVSDSAELTVSVRANCESGPELACALGAMVTAPVVEGEAVYIVVDGVSVDDVGTFELTAMTRSVVCGDGVIDPGEQCDDAGSAAGDGCDESCQVESTETNPQGNDTIPQAEDYVEPFYGMISPVGDIDLIQVDLAGGSSTLRVRTLGLGSDACVNGDLDSYLEILDSGGGLLAENDDANGELCADVSASGLAADSYYVRVTAAPTGATPEFPYQLEILID